MTRALAFLIASVCALGCAAGPVPAAAPSPTPSPPRERVAARTRDVPTKIAIGRGIFCQLIGRRVICRDECSGREEIATDEAIDFDFHGLLACALIQDRTVRCWHPFRDEPSQVGELSNVERIAVGIIDLCAVKGGEGVRCFRFGESGYVAWPALPPREKPPPPVEPALPDATSIGLCVGTACFATASGTTYCTGANDRGQAGHSGPKRIVETVPVPGVADAQQVVATVGFGCALETRGRVTCWGDQIFAQSPLGTGMMAPAPVPRVSDVVQLAAGYVHVCSLNGRGTVMCWGLFKTPDGRRARGDPIPIAGLGNVKAIAAGGTTTCALRADGTVKCWGHSGQACAERGQLPGTGELNDSF